MEETHGLCMEETRGRLSGMTGTIRTMLQAILIHTFHGSTLFLREEHVKLFVAIVDEDGADRSSSAG